VNKKRAESELVVGTIKNELTASRGKKTSALLELYGHDRVVSALKEMLSEDLVKNAVTVYAATVILKEEWLVKHVARKINARKIGSKKFQLKVFNDCGKHYF